MTFISPIYLVQACQICRDSRAKTGINWAILDYILKCGLKIYLETCLSCLLHIGTVGTGISKEMFLCSKRLVKAQNWSGTGEVQTCQGHTADVAWDSRCFLHCVALPQCLQGCKEMAVWDLSCCADLDKNHPGQSRTPLSNSLSLNSALGRSRTEDHLGMCKNFLVSFVTGTIKIFWVFRYAFAFQVIT